MNAQALAIAASPDGSTIYVGGVVHSGQWCGAVSYRGVLGVDRRARRQLQATAPRRQSVRITATRVGTVYFGGDFTTVDGHAARLRRGDRRRHGSAACPSIPNADAAVHALTLNHSGSKRDPRRPVRPRRRQRPGSAWRPLTPSRAAVLPVGGHRHGAQLRAAGGVPLARLGRRRRLRHGLRLRRWRETSKASFMADNETGALIWIEDCHGDTLLASSPAPITSTSRATSTTAATSAASGRPRRPGPTSTRRLVRQGCDRHDHQPTTWATPASLETRVPTS